MLQLTGDALVELQMGGWAIVVVFVDALVGAFADALIDVVPFFVKPIWPLLIH